MAYATGILILLSIIISLLRSQWFSLEGKSDYATLCIQSIWDLFFTCRRDCHCGKPCTDWPCPPFLLHPIPPSCMLFLLLGWWPFPSCFLILICHCLRAFASTILLLQNPFKDEFLPLVCRIWHSQPLLPMFPLPYFS